MPKIDTSELQKIITGRVVPYIYSFITNTLPNYLKVGDTYRPVEERLKEWRRHYKDLKEVSRHKAIINDGVFFRDYAVHKYLQQKGIPQVPLNVSKNVYSNEFFDGAKESDVKEAVDDIVRNYKKAEIYQYYNNAKDKIEYHHERVENFGPRQNQKEVIDKFALAIKNGRTNLLMYAVMRFGKSITSMWSAKSIDSKLTVVVSAKADVLAEWKQTVESHIDFKGYRFIDKNDLKNDVKLPELFGKKFQTGSGYEEICTNVVLFLTLQDLAGSNQTIKSHHKLLKNAQIDLLIIDETHFGARAQVLGKILAGVEIDEDEKKSLKNDTEDPINFGSLDKLGALNAKIKLHLSGTPYRILMGSEFKDEDVIASVQFSDIYKAKLDWRAKHLEQNEWENPYYGFPQMIRFAFNPNESSRKKLLDIVGGKPSDLFQPINTNRNGEYRTFQYEQEVVDLLQVLDGSKNDLNMLGLLDNETIKAGKLAQHVVMVLPYRASCDALVKLVSKYKKDFKNLSEYRLLNISGYDQGFTNIDQVKSTIAESAKKGQKTITLTVNKMLTGTTVPQWDTMIYLKGTVSPQEYDQAIFRLQSKWIETYQDKNGDMIKYDMKPQTLLIDLDPTRLFYLQELKAFTYGVNNHSAGNENIEEFIQTELEISPIISLNAEGNKLIEVTATNIIDQARDYANGRTITEDVQEIGVDMSLKDNPAILEIISKFAELNSKTGITSKPYQEEGQDFDNLESKLDGDETGIQNPNPKLIDSKEDNTSFEKRWRTYYALILLFSFLSKTEEKSLSDVISNIDGNQDNRRIARNLGLKKLDLQIIKDDLNSNVRRDLDYKIQNSDFRSQDESITTADHIDVAIHKFGRLSESEIFTPAHVVNRMFDSFDNSVWKDVNNMKVLDIASKSGIFAKVFAEKAIQSGTGLDSIKNNFYSIPTSSAAYEFTRKMYEALGLNIDNIAMHFNSYDLIKLNHGELQYLLSQDKKFCDITLDDLKKFDKITDINPSNNMKFTAIVGNPPYQENGKDNNRATPIYNFFMDAAYLLADQVCLITPARFLFNAGQTPKSWNKKMLNDKHIKVVYYEQDSSKVFLNTDITGGVVVTVRDVNKDYGSIGLFTHLDDLRSILNKVTINKFVSFNKMLFGRSSYKFTPKLYIDNPKLRGRVKRSEERSIGSNIFDKLPEVFFDIKQNNDQVRIIGRYENRRVFKWINRDYIEKHENLEKFKVLVPKSNGTGAIGEILNTPVIGEPLIGEPLVGHTQTFISFGALSTRSEANAVLKYIKTKFARTLLGTMKITQDNATNDVWKNVPLQDFTKKSDINWTKSIAEIDKQLYKKYGLDNSEINFIETNVKAMN